MAEAEAMNGARLTGLEPDSAGVAGGYLRAFSEALGHFDAFGPFLERLGEVVRDDRYFKGEAELRDPQRETVLAPDFGEIRPGETVVPVVSEAGETGHIRYRGRADGQALGAEDLHLMGAIAGMVSRLVLHARNFHQKDQAARVLRYLVDQLPLAVLCLDAEGRPVVENRAATERLGERGADVLRPFAEEAETDAEAPQQIHFESEGRLIYAEGRRFSVDAETEITAYVLYELTAYRDKLLRSVDREVFRADARGGRATFFLIDAPEAAGRLYARIGAMAESIGTHADSLQPVDASGCAGVVPAISLREVRRRLRGLLGSDAVRKDMRVALLDGSEVPAGAADPGVALLAKARGTLQPAAEALVPVLGVLDPYPGVRESLALALEGACRVVRVADGGHLRALVERGVLDKVLVDLDSCGNGEALELEKNCIACDRAVVIGYASHTRPEMARERHKLDRRATIMQKPFDTTGLLQWMGGDAPGR